MAEVASRYRERRSRLTDAVVWTNTNATGAAALPVLPDGCMDLLWSEGRLLVAGPDTRAYMADGAVGRRWVGIRFAPGTAPALLGVPAHELRDRRVDLADLWSPATARRLAEQVGAARDQPAALEAIALRRASEAESPDPVLRRIVGALDAGWSVAATAAAAAGLGARVLHRRSLAAFGYGPKTLARILRLQRALAVARSGVPLADTAVRTGFADQAHLARDVRELAGMRLSELLTRA
ncbi:helix-turn-helix domain-containing protein [Nocardia sp. CA-129566]|uniref:helix-turn-helix domain-containing protein n=1 Tax=Nocardia sp. CA-129566 TaxID=3239976 RepID=UPI003D96E78D